MRSPGDLYGANVGDSERRNLSGKSWLYVGKDTGVPCFPGYYLGIFGN